MTKIARTYRIEEVTDRAIKSKAQSLGISEAKVIDFAIEVGIVQPGGLVPIFQASPIAVPRKALDAAGAHPNSTRSINDRSGSNPYTRERQTRRAKK